MPALQIYDPRERRLVGAADRALSLISAVRSAWRRAVPAPSPRRILLLRLERIGDLLMILPALADLRALAPRAEIDLVVGSWNEALARTIPGLTRIEPLDAGWLARGVSGGSMAALVRHARQWRGRRYDLAINFEPDIRSNLLLAVSGARFTAGYVSGGGGPLLDRAVAFDTTAHTTDNARALVAGAFGRRPEGAPDTAALLVPETARQDAAARIPSSASRPIVGVHVSGGRAIKQWPPARFAEVARHLAGEYGATIVLTGAAEDRPVVDGMRAALHGCEVLDVSGAVDLPTLAALLQRLDLYVTGDTGPMHLAGAVGTPVVAIFGPSDPVRYALRSPHDRIVRVELPCSPCNRVRRPPQRCAGHTPDCLSFVAAGRVIEAAVDVLASTGALHGAHAGRA